MIVLWIIKHHSLGQFTFNFILISAIAPFITTFQRSQVISFIHALDDVHDEVAIKNPTDTFNFGAYTDPLQLWSWIFIAIFCIVCPPFLYFTARQVEENHRMFQSFLTHIYHMSFFFMTLDLVAKIWSISNSLWQNLSW